MEKLTQPVRYAGRLLFCVLTALFICAAALAQENTGKILGTVTDDSGAVIAGATVTAESPTLPQGLQTTTDAAGNYVLERVPIGTYTVTVASAGFANVRKQNVVVRLGSEVKVDARLKIGDIAQTVEVTAAAITVDPTKSSTSTNITDTQFDNLSHGRSFNSILTMAPGVRTEVKGGNAGVGGIQVDGASGSENVFVIDGVDVSDVRRGSLRAAHAIPLEFIKEVQVKSAGFEAEYGGATGGVVNIATKSGSNEFHGNFNMLWTTNGLNAGDRGFWQRSPLNANQADFFRPKEDDYHILYPGGALGGPIMKDRLYFFGSYSPEIEKTDRTNDYASGSRKFPQKIRRHFGLGRLDYSPSQKVQVNTSYIWSPTKVKGRLADRDVRVPAPSNDLSIQGGYQPAQAYSASATVTATPHLVLSARYGYKYLNDKLGNYGLSGAPYLIYRTASSAAPGVPAHFAGPNGFSNVSSTFAIVKDITTRHNVYLDGTYLINLLGQQHTFQAGYQVARLSNDTNDDYTNGQFDIYWGEAFSRGSVTNVRGTYGYYIWQDGVRHVGKVNSRNQGFYIQDAWRPTSRLALNIGVRFENEFLPPFKKEVNGVKVANPVSFGWGDKIAPRIGVAYDVLGDGKWKVSGSFGLFYDVLKYELARGSFGGDYWVSHVFKLDKPDVPTLGKASAGALGTEIISYDNRTIPINAAGELEGIDPNIKPYKSREFTVSVDHELRSGMIAGVRYSRKDLLRAIEDIGVLDASDNEVYLIGNPGFGQTRDTKSVYGQKTPNGQEFLVPEATRQYDGVEFHLQTQYKQLNFLSSYTWSRLWGNYSGSANSDESGRSDPGVSRAFDLPYYYFDSTGSQQNVFGRLGTDRPHTFKFFGSYDLKSRLGDTIIGVNQVAYSGTPDSTSVIYLSAPTFPFGRGDLGRTPAFVQTDLLLAHSYKVTERTSLKFEADFRNLFNRASVISRTTQINRSSAITAAKLPLSKFFAGYTLSNYVNPQNSVGGPPYNPIYGLPGASYRAGGGPTPAVIGASSAFSASNPNFGAFQDFRRIQLGLRLLF